ncbi:MAG TPA: DUF1800 domain-containing protein [Chitinophagaceae bacterium]|nr:DUF1800 domain-containing protein [Chitinophagaceae bacterium]
MSVVADSVKIQHLYWRARLGITPADLLSAEHRHLKKLIAKTMRGGESRPSEITVPQTEEISRIQPGQFKSMSPEQRRALFKTSEEGIRALNLGWIAEMCATDHPLLEKMALFWHGHFACRVPNVKHNQQLLQVIRDNALGNFGDLLTAVSKSPAMLQFLNNQQNRKQHPNENFAREVMELFTMGRGNYTEEDVKQGARAFTGWGFDPTGEFRFRPNLHDDGEKLFLGKTGNFTGEDVLRIILEQKDTAYFITGKLYRFFVNDNPDESIIRPLSEQFYQSNYDLKELMGTLFSSDWFYDQANVGAIIKSPVELMAGMIRTVPATFQKPQVLVLFQRVLGQVLFYPPNVAGWPGGKSWIDSSTLMFRLRLPQLLYYSQEFSVHPKDMPDEIMDDGMTMQANDATLKQMSRKVEATVNWDPYLKAFDAVSQEDLPGAIASALIVNAPKRIDKSLLDNFSDQGSREHYIETLTINLMSTPEYQLC